MDYYTEQSSGHTEDMLLVKPDITIKDKEQQYENKSHI